MRTRTPRPRRAGRAPDADDTAFRTTPLITIKDASFGYAGTVAPALTDVRLHVLPGEAIALIGPNGAGKSTLFKGLLGLLPPRTGSVSGSPRMGYLPQSDHIDPDFPIRVRQVVTMGRYAQRGWLRPLRAADRQAVDRALERTALTGLAERVFGDLSGGQRQRALLARAIASDPQLLLLDEPFNGLDQPSREALMATVAALVASGVAVILSTHDVALAQATCTRALLIDRRVVAAGPVDRVVDGSEFAEVFQRHDPHASAGER
ncbi:metal ABC transporter ATP-binding protein [Microbacterium xanthum]|uniref:metal ABC transporter ATP-binding protein n=1 Tax=Microbacterium xanthum TaxID=3079794 RepID=UPI002AD4416C|nr:MULTISPECIES: metal ABC transporter ATP-binding protein [unclassified Microbacterium]MDZ8171769.1 metal ABC transporter ATP-binding protein [Microbacterium sp. KSW-48]MDZ8200128.1 metal ABC transporter ATP-binding protein [Microbacterium sp. SSW1-59]